MAALHSPIRGLYQHGSHNPSVLDYAMPLASHFATQSSDFGISTVSFASFSMTQLSFSLSSQKMLTNSGDFWGPGLPEFGLTSSHTTALEAQALSSLFTLDAADIFQDDQQVGEQSRRAEIGQSRRAEADRKRKMSSSREDHSREQQPKRRRETAPFHQPQYVAPHELITSSVEMPPFVPLPSPTEGVRRQASAGPAFDQRRPVEPRATYSQSQYLQAPEPDWSRSPHRTERPMLPSISSTPGYTGSPQVSPRSSTSYSIPSIPSSYHPVMSQPYYDRSGSYSYTPTPTEFEHRHSASSMTSQGPLPRASEAMQLDAEGRPNKPQCWDHGCNGRYFSTYSNFLRHQRERDGTSAKSSCPRCGAEFTRSTARNGHLKHAKCKSPHSPDPGGDSQSDQQ